jgi:hypothetical protein
MYVLSSMPANKQSIAGSLLQTLTRLCTAIAYGIATAIFDTVDNSPSKSGYYANNVAEPFAAVFWFAAGTAFIGVLFVPFLRITTQGHKGDTGRVKGGVENSLGLDDGHNVAAVGEKSGHVNVGEDTRTS